MHAVLAVASADVTAAREWVEADSSRGLSEAERIASSRVADFTAETTTCPACDTVFTTAGTSRCPECDLNFG